MSRDPRIDPQADDLILATGPNGVKRYFRVHSVGRGQVYGAVGEDLDLAGDPIRVTIDAYRRDAVGAEVVEAHA